MALESAAAPVYELGLLMSQTFLPGQRYTSLAGPELGLGLVVQSDFKFVSILFPAADQTIQFAKNTAPLARAIFEKGDEVLGPDHHKHIVQSAREVDGIFYYQVQGKELIETQLSPQTQYQKLEDKIFTGQFSSSKLFNVRARALELEGRILRSPVRGLIGPSINLIPHQLYVTQAVTAHPYPRVMLADEVGLGKTIEAGLILHSLLISGRAKKALIIVPYALSNQWYLELRKHFHLKATLVNKAQTLEQEDNIFEESQAIITSLEFITTYPAARELILKASWDLLIVDEAHRIGWEKGKPSVEFLLLEALGQKTPGVLLLSATPEKHGHEAHFERLKILDPHRFSDYSRYLKDIEKFEELVGQVEHLEEVDPHAYQHEMKKIIDEQGTGRVLFRNTRAYLEKLSPVSAPRVIHPAPLENEKMRDAWLWDFLQAHPEEKILLIAGAKSIITHLERFLTGKGFNSLALFHSDLSLLDRDRHAVQFSQDDGPQLLLCSEIGSEGRNFQFCHHLILFDLPADMEMIEQRIGRLDRIGQEEQVNLHIPYLKNTFEEVLFRWLHEGVNAFGSYVQGAAYIYEQSAAELQAARQDPDHFLAHPKKMKKWLDETSAIRQSVQNFLNTGMNRLLGLNSFDLEAAKKIVADIKTQENDPSLFEFMELVFETVGVESQEVRPGIYYLTAGDNMLIPHFPGLGEEGVRVTFERKLALIDENVEFLSIDHPMVLSVLDMFVGQGLAAVAVANWQNTTTAVLELIFEMHLLAPHRYTPERFFPGHSIRKVFALDGRDVTANLPVEKLRDKIQELTPQGMHKLKDLPRASFKQLIKKVKEQVTEQSQVVLEQYTAHLQKVLSEEHLRLSGLKKRGGNVSDQDLAFLAEQERVLVEAMKSTRPKLHSLRFIF